MKKLGALALLAITLLVANGCGDDENELNGFWKLSRIEVNGSPEAPGHEVFLRISDDRLARISTTGTIENKIERNGNKIRGRVESSVGTRVRQLEWEWEVCECDEKHLVLKYDWIGADGKKKQIREVYEAVSRP